MLAYSYMILKVRAEVFNSWIILAVQQPNLFHLFFFLILKETNRSKKTAIFE